MGRLVEAAERLKATQASIDARPRGKGWKWRETKTGNRSSRTRMRDAIAALLEPRSLKLKQRG
jgi:hypothetical protein